LSPAGVTSVSANAKKPSAMHSSYPAVRSELLALFRSPWHVAKLRYKSLFNA